MKQQQKKKSYITSNFHFLTAVIATTTIAKPKDTLLETPKGGGELPIGKLSKMTLTPNSGTKMKPFTKKSPKQVIG